MNNLNNNELNLIGTEIKNSLILDCQRPEYLIFKNRPVNEIAAILEDLSDFFDAYNFDKSEVSRLACALLINTMEFKNPEFQNDFKNVFSTLIKNLNN